MILALAMVFPLLTSADQRIEWKPFEQVQISPTRVDFLRIQSAKVARDRWGNIKVQLTVQNTGNEPIHLITVELAAKSADGTPRGSRGMSYDVDIDQGKATIDFVIGHDKASFVQPGDIIILSLVGVKTSKTYWLQGLGSFPLDPTTNLPLLSGDVCEAKCQN